MDKMVMRIRLIRDKKKRSNDDNGTLYGIELDLTGKTAIVLILVLGTCLNFAAERVPSAK